MKKIILIAIPYGKREEAFRLRWIVYFS